ncbi:MAG: hypothetical protein IPP43_15765 [Chitinophagaceae bacterium]|nr:hypothetical protein [Chitinophagaceae bacterium]
MKSILYVGATLMICASIYGFVDSKKTSRNKEFKNMYKESPVPEAVTVVTREKTEPVVKKENSSNPKTTKAKNQATKSSEYDLPIKPIPDEDKIAPKERKGIEKTTVNVSVSKEGSAEKSTKKKRKLNTKLFSRGSLDDRYVEPKEKTELPKEGVKKTENKEQ